MPFRLFLFSDLHRDVGAARRLAGQVVAVSPAALISSGDLGLDGVSEPAVLDAFRRVERPVYSVPGNHDRDPAYTRLLEAAGWTDLDGRALALEGWTIAGRGHLEGQADYGGPDAALQREDPALTALFARLEPVPATRIVLVTHLPPWGTLAARDRRFVDRGSAQLRRWVDARQPAAVACGHVHHREPVVERVGATVVANAGPHGYLLTLP